VTDCYIIYENKLYVIKCVKINYIHTVRQTYTQIDCGNCLVWM